MFYAINFRKIKKFIFLILFFFGLLFLLYTAVRAVYPIKHGKIISYYAQKYGLRETLIYGVIYTESRFRESVQSPKGASGLMQLAAITADWGAEELEIENYDYSRVFEPEICIQIGSWYLAKLIEQYGSEDVALAAYNAGSGNVSKWLGDTSYSSDGKNLHTIPYGETRRYIERVRKNERIYEILLTINRFIKLEQVSR